ncbi:MAG TPA: MFS transporter [Chitinophagales bacterium]|nr:MFS transporter [Chitinophagales bacterium]
MAIQSDNLRPPVSVGEGAGVKLTTAQLGLKANWRQFTLLVIINGFVGAMLGIERTLVPELGRQVFHLEFTTAILSFIIVFGVVKATANYYAGSLANRIGRKNILVLGWLAALPVPFILIYAGSWNWILLANIFLGINQGLCWSTTVMMKIDLVGTSNRGLAMGLNEFAGYVSLGTVAFITGYIASVHGLRPQPFYLGIALSAAGLLSSILLVKDTAGHVRKEAETTSSVPSANVFLDTTFRNRNLSSVTQAGLVNNLNDGMMWGLFPLLLKSKGFDYAQIGIIVAVYPAVWGVTQLFTGFLSDKLSRKPLLFWGMLLQGLALFAMAGSGNFYFYLFISVLLGLGTALVYPTFLAAVADFSHPIQRAKSIGVFRFWRDSGYVFGALITGIVMDRSGYTTAIIAVAVLTMLSALVIQFRMRRKKIF